MAFKPVAAFIAMSMLFGTLMVLATPPLRGPDETAHFLRAYGVAQGDIVPSLRDDQGRKGVLLPPRLHDGFEFFEAVRVKEKPAGFGYRAVFKSYLSRPSAVAPDSPPRFVPYAGSEGYSPVAYLPQTAAALIARGLDLEFLATLYLMRFAGLAALTALIAFAVAMAPQLAWAMIAIAMLPGALYGRSVINADGCALAAAMVVTALWLRGIAFAQFHIPGRQAFWLMVCALTKPTNLAFVLLELSALLGPLRRWRMLALTTMPAIAITVFWTLRSGADTAAWRMVELTGQQPVTFDAAARLRYLLEDPLHFPAAVLHAVRGIDLGELWRQVIGVLGLFDTVLQAWVYPTVSALLLATFFMRLRLPQAARWRVAVVAAITTLAYTATVYLICYVSFTPLNADTVWGVQGRYFIPILPLVAIVLAAIVDRAPHERFRAVLATCAAVLSGLASLEAILRADWKF
jgi:uncharacterized membrane protein